MTFPDLDAPVSPLCQRLIDDMNLRSFSRETQRNYLRDIGRLAAFLGRSPDTATPDDLRRFQIEQQEDGVLVPTMNSIVSALRFLFIHTLDRPDLARRLVRLAHRRNLPVVLSRDEVARLLNATTCLKHQAALSVAYGAGLRVAEVSMLKVADVDSDRMLSRVERGKGGRYRNAMLSEDLLMLLREWWKVGRQQGVMHRDRTTTEGSLPDSSVQHCGRSTRPRWSTWPCQPGQVRVPEVGGGEDRRPAVQGREEGHGPRHGGYLHFRDADKKPQFAVISVKGGGIKSGDIRDLKGAMEREKAAMGIS
jgi:integrase